MAMCDNVIQYAEKWLGYLEKKSNAQLESLTANAGDGNYTIFAKQYKDLWGEDYQAQPWCAVSVSVWLYYGCKKEIVSHFSYCPYGVEWFKKRGQWHTSNPKRGDVVFFKDSQGVACHVGMVSSVGNGVIVTIEGNTSSESGVVANGGCVRKKSYSISYSRILGYGRPAYEDDTNTTEEDENMTIDKFKELMSEYRGSLRDNDCKTYSKEAREWAIEKKLIEGSGTTANGEPNYMWEDMLTREQFITVLYRFAKETGML